MRQPSAAAPSEEGVRAGRYVSSWHPAHDSAWHGL